MVTWITKNKLEVLLKDASRKAKHPLKHALPQLSLELLLGSHPRTKTTFPSILHSQRMPCDHWRQMERRGTDGTGALKRKVVNGCASSTVPSRFLPTRSKDAEAPREGRAAR